MAYYPEYVPVAKKKVDAQKKIAKLTKKNPDITPVVIEGTKIAKTWWGVAWNKNLESYADYSNRIGRGRSYVKNGLVLDLQIKTGIVTALVLGSRQTPYAISIRIAPISGANWAKIAEQCSHSIAGIEELLSGKFPKALEGLFTQRGSGLFPSPQEIKFNCSCPDWAYMCKHVAAALYGIGARLDTDPTLFFKLRDVPFEELLKKSIEVKMQSMLKNSDKKTQRVMEDGNLGELFGI